MRSPAVVVLDRGLNVLWRHEGVRIRDYPPVSDVCDIALKLAQTGP